MAVFICSACGVQVFARQATTIETALCLRCRDRDGVTIEYLTEATVVSFAGELDLITVGDFRDALQEAISLSRPVRIDLGRCTFMDSTGLHVLREALANRNGKGGIEISDSSSSVRRLLGLVGLDGLTGPSPGRGLAAMSEGGGGL